MESTSEIIDLVIQKCIELFELEQQKVDFLPNGINYGKPPKTAIIAYGLGEMKKIGYQITDIQKKWLYENGCLKKVLARKCKRMVRNKSQFKGNDILGFEMV